MRVLVDVGSHAIKALAVEILPSAERFRVIKKFVLKLPPGKGLDRVVQARGSDSDALRTITKLREFLFSLLKEFERVPQKILVAFGPSLADYSIQTWNFYPEKQEKNISRDDASLYFYTLLSQHRDWKKSVMAEPLEMTVNGYPVRFGEERRPTYTLDRGSVGTLIARPGGFIPPPSLAPSGLAWSTKEVPKSLPRDPIPREKVGGFIRFPQKMPVEGELGFRVILLSFQETIGRRLLEMKESLGGMPIEFIPLVAAHAEGVLTPLRLEDAFFIDIGGEETTLASFKEGSLIYAAAFPVGARHFIRGISTITSLSFDEAENAKRRYAHNLTSEAAKRKLNEFLTQEFTIWEQQFLRTLDDFYPFGPLPADIFLFGGGTYIPEISNWVRSSNWYKDFSYVSSPRVKVLAAHSIFVGDSLGGFLQGPEDVGLASLLIYSLNHESIF